MSACAKTSEPEIAKSGNANQTAAIANQAAVISTNAAVNNSVSANNAAAINNQNGAAAIPPNVPAATANNAAPQATTTAANGKDQKNAPAASNAPKPQIGSGGSDFLLFTQVRGALNADKDFVTAVIVDVKEGNVILTGSVPSEAQKTRAAQLAGAIKGVKSVKNSLRVAS